jgi:hypothetical protein
MSLFRKRKTKHQEAGSRKDQAVIDRGLRAIYLDAKGQVPSLIPLSARLLESGLGVCGGGLGA